MTNFENGIHLYENFMNNFEQKERKNLRANIQNRFGWYYK